MTQADFSPLSQQEPLSQEHIIEQGCISSEFATSIGNPQFSSIGNSSIEDMHRHDNDISNETPFFPIVENVTFKSLEPAPEREAWHLSAPVARLVSLVSLGAVVLWPLGGCNSTGDSNLPCPVPTSNSTGTPITTGTPTIKCTTSGGTHYIWFPSHGGWVTSSDGTHPDPNAHGVGEDTGHGGVGGGNDGTGHGGSDGG